MNLRLCDTPLIYYIEFAGIHTDPFPSLRREPPLQNSPSALMTGRLRQVCFQAARIAAFIPSFATEGSGSSSRSFKAINKGHVTIAQADPDAGWTAPIHIITTQKPGSRWTAWSFLWCSPSVLRRKSDIYQWEKKEDISKMLNRVGYEQLEEEY